MSCTCDTRRIPVAGEGVAEAVARYDPECPAHGFPEDRWRAGSPLERFALTLCGRKESPRETAARLIAETRGGMLGRVYYERGEPVVVLARWRWSGRRTVRNVLIRRCDGSKAVRPFRGLRREPRPAITDADRRYFSEGECASLAVHLHDLRGFPLAITGNDYHAFVVVAPRTALDVFGVRSIREITRTLGSSRRHKRVARSHFGPRTNWLEPPRITARTRRIAAALLAELDREPPAA